MGKTVRKILLLSMLIILTGSQGTPEDATGVCDSMEGSECSQVIQKEVLRFVTIDMTSTGESATDDSIVGLAKKTVDLASSMVYAAWNKVNPFYSSESLIVKGKRENFTLYDRDIATVNIPGFFETAFSMETINETIRCTNMIAPGPHVILLVARANHQTQEVLNALNLMTKIFGDDLVKHLVTIFTYGSNIKRSGESMEAFLDLLKGVYKDLYLQANNQYILFDNTFDITSKDNEQQVRELITMADKIISINHGQYYRNDVILNESYRSMQKEEEKYALKLLEERKKQVELQRKARENELHNAELQKLKNEIQLLELEGNNATALRRKLADMKVVAHQRARKDCFRFVMVGMTGTGKSATGNSIVGLAKKALDMVYAAVDEEKPFYSRSSSESVTVVGKRVNFTIFGREIAIVDTPGFFDTRFTIDTTIEEILKCIYLITPGPHAFLLVARADRQTTEVLNALELMKKIFGDELVKYLVIVFTYGDNLKRDGETIEAYVDRLKGPYKDLLQQADNRYISFDNTLDPNSKDNEQQVRQLLDIVDKILDGNRDQYYSNDILEESYRLMKEEEERQAQKLEEERKKQEELERKARENDIFIAELEKKKLEIEQLKLDYKNAEARARKLAESEASRGQRQQIKKRSGGCFASSSTVLVQGPSGKKIYKSLEDLKVGDLVESYDPDTKSVVFSPVYYIIYKDDNKTVSVLRRLFYEDADGRVGFVALHPKHILYANSLDQSPLANSQDFPLPLPEMSEDVKVGDILWIKDASGQLYPKPVFKIDEVTSRVRHPLTFSHYIIVDRVLASVHMHNEWLSRRVTAPLRLLYNISPSLGDVWVTKEIVHSWDWVERNLLE